MKYHASYHLLSTSPTFKPSEISHVSYYYFVTFPFTLQVRHERINHTKLINIYTQFSNVQSIDQSGVDRRWMVFEKRRKKGELTATRVLRASIRIVAGQASGEAVGSKLLDRSRVSIHDYCTAIFRFHSSQVFDRRSDSPGSTSISRDPFCSSGDMAPPPI